MRSYNNLLVLSITIANDNGLFETNFSGIFDFERTTNQLPIDRNYISPDVKKQHSNLTEISQRVITSIQSNETCAVFGEYNIPRVPALS